MAPGESNGRVTDDVTWLRKVKVVTQIWKMPIISKMVGDRDCRKWHLGNQMVTWRKTSRDPDRSRSWHQ